MSSKKVFFILLFVFFFLGFVSAVEIDVKDSVKKGENFIVKVTGNFVTPLTESQVKFFRQGHINTEFGNIDLEKIEGDYYFYLKIPLEKLADNYTIVIEDAKYKSGVDTITADIKKSFLIVDEIVPFTITPPLIIAHEEYSVEVQNVWDSKITIDLEASALPVGEEVEEEENITEEEKKSFFESLFGSDEEEINETNESSGMTGAAITTEPITLNPGEKKVLTFLAPEKKGFEKLKLYSEGFTYSALVYNPEDRVGETTVGEDNITIEEPEENVTIEENETVTEEPEENATTPSEIEVTENGSIINTSTNEEIGSTLKTCNESGGVICKYGGIDTCSNPPTIQVSDGTCCFGECVEVKKSNTGKIIGWSIIIVIALFLTWFFKNKYKKTNPGSVNLTSIAGGKK